MDFVSIQKRPKSLSPSIYGRISREGGTSSRCFDTPTSLQERSIASRVSFNNLTTSQRYKRRKTRKERTQIKENAKYNNNLTPEELKHLAKVNRTNSHLRIPPSPPPPPLLLTSPPAGETSSVTPPKVPPKPKLKKSTSRAQLPLPPPPPEPPAVPSQSNFSFLSEIKSRDLKNSLRKVHPENQFSRIETSKSKGFISHDEEKKSIWKSLTSELESKLRERSQQKKSNKDFDRLEKKSKLSNSISFNFKDNSSWLLRNVTLKTKDSFNLKHEPKKTEDKTHQKDIKIKEKEIENPPTPLAPEEVNQPSIFETTTVKPPEDVLSISPETCSLPSHLKDSSSSEDKESSIFPEPHLTQEPESGPKFIKKNHSKLSIKDKRVRNKTIGFIPVDDPTPSYCPTPFKKDFRYFSLPPASSAVIESYSSRPSDVRCVYDFDSLSDTEDEYFRRSASALYGKIRSSRPPPQIEEIQVSCPDMNFSIFINFFLFSQQFLVVFFFSIYKFSKLKKYHFQQNSQKT